MKLLTKNTIGSAIIFLIAFLLSSCAILYTGEDIPTISQDRLEKVECSATFRFLVLLDYDYIHSNKVKFKVSNVDDPKLYSDYLNELGVFKEIKVTEFSLGGIDVQNKSQLNDYIKSNLPEVHTDYFVDVHMIKPFSYHGTGLGMWGGFFSALTLGILPAWWTHKTDYRVYIYRDGQKINEANLTNNYNSFSSILFYIVPGHETFINSAKRIMTPNQNELNNIVKDITKKICKR